MIPTRGLDNDGIEWIKITETKNATTFALATVGLQSFICVALKKTLLIYEVTRKKSRYGFWREIQMPLNIQTLTCFENMVGVGTNSNFVVYNVNDREQPPWCKLDCVHFYLFTLIVSFILRPRESRVQ